MIHKKNIFQCRYCSRSFSRQGAFRNHLRVHRDQMFIDENNLTREENIEPRSTGAKRRAVLSPIIINDTMDPHEEHILNVNVHDFEEV
jgi:uncharacterized Zn-finger protein